MTEVLAGYPLAEDDAGVYKGAKGRALPVAQSWMESNYGQAANAQTTHNPLGLFWDAQWAPGAHASDPPLLIFPNWGEAFAEWSRRMDDPGYKSGVYPRDATLEQYIVTYVGGPMCWSTKGKTCANGETWDSCHHYLTETINRLNRYFGVEGAPPPTGGQSYTVAGLAQSIPLSFPLKQMLVPRALTLNRPGIPLSATRWVQHETDNVNPGAGAFNQAQYLVGGAEGRQASWHFTVDDKEAYQTIPVNEVAWHGGDGNGPCNMGGVSCELCVNMINDPARMAKARHNAEELAGQIMKAMSLSIIERHADCCARLANPGDCHAGCPRYIIRDGYWGTFVSGARSWATS